MSDENRTFRLIYRSHNQMPPEGRRTGLGTLFTQARANNKGLQITGALMLSGDWFVQTLEGDKFRVRSLFDHIEKDERHDRVSLVDTGFVADRAFPRWSMAQVSDDGEADTYLIAHADGIAPASSRGTSAAQEAVLDLMRSAARDRADGSNA